MNVLALWAVAQSKGYDCGEWATYNQWQDRGAVLAVNTTCRGIELKNLRWADADMFQREMAIRRSKTDAGRRDLPINSDAMAALARLRERAEALGSAAPEHFVFPACERSRIDPTKPQKTWRTAWRSLVEETAKRAGNSAAKAAVN